MATQRHQDDLDILKEIKSDMQEFKQQTQQQFRQVFHLIEDLTIDINSLTEIKSNFQEFRQQSQTQTRLIEKLTIDVNSLKRHVNHSTSPIRNLGENIKRGHKEIAETINDPQAACVNDEFQMQEVLHNTEGIIIEGMISNSIAFCTRFVIFG